MSKMKLIEHYRAIPFFYFFLAMLALILLSPLVEQARYGAWFVRGLFTIMLVAAIYAASGRRSFLIVALILAVPWILVSWLGDIGLWQLSTLVTDGIVVGLYRFISQALGEYGTLLPGNDIPLPSRGYVNATAMFAQGFAVASGTTEIQRNLIAQRGLGLPR